MKAFDGLCPVFSGLPVFEGLLRPLKAQGAQQAGGGGVYPPLKDGSSRWAKMGGVAGGREVLLGLLAPLGPHFFEVVFRSAF